MEMSDKILVTRAVLPDINEYMQELREVWDSHWLTNMGPKHEMFRSHLKSYLNVEDIELFTNGHMALELTLQAFNLQGEVITTPFTFASTTHAIVRNGLEPVFCDIEPDNYTIDTSKIEELITDRTCAILPVHVYGNICKIEEIERIACKYGLKVIYDAAHAFGEYYNGKSIGSYGDASCFSFHATKVFNTIEGGATCYKGKELGSCLYELKNFGIHDAECVTAVGANAKMNEFCAAMGICNLRHIEDNIEKRKKVVNRYYENLKDIAGIYLNDFSKIERPNYAYFPIVIDEKIFGASRNEVCDKLLSKGIEPRKYFYPLTNSFSAFHKKYDIQKTPNALRVSKRVLTLPLYPDIQLDIVDRICELITKSVG